MNTATCSKLSGFGCFLALASLLDALVVNNKQQLTPCSLLVTTACPPTSCLLKLSSLGSDVRSCVAVRLARCRSKVLVGDACSPGTLDEDCVLASRRSCGQLIECETLAACLEDSLPGTLGKPKRANGQLWNLIDSLVIENITDNNSDLVFARFMTHVVDLMICYAE